VLLPFGGDTQLSRVLAVLDRTRAAAGGRGAGGAGGVFEAACSAVAGRLRRRSLVLVVSDLMAGVDEIARGLAHLGRRRHAVELIRVLHRDEIEFPLSGYVRLQGREGEPEVAGEAAHLRDRYLAALAAHRRGVARAAGSHRAGVTEMVSDTDVAVEVARLLRTRR